MGFSRPSLAVSVILCAVPSAMPAFGGGVLQQQVTVQQAKDPAGTSDKKKGEGAWVLELLDKEGKPAKGSPIQAGDLKGVWKALYKALPEGQADAIPSEWTEIAQDPMAKQIDAQPGTKTLAVLDGKPLGIKFQFDKKEYVYRPPQKMAFTIEAPTVLVLNQKSGKLQEKQIDKLSAKERQLAKKSMEGLQSLAAGLDFGALLKGFDNGIARGDVQGGVRGRSGLKKSAGEGFQQPPNDFKTDNAYGEEMPEKLEKGHYVWQGKNLMQVVAPAEAGGKPELRAVGYMAAMNDDAKGKVLFWHGGDEPDKDGNPKSEEAKAWALFSVDQGNSSVMMGKYYDFAMTDARISATPSGKRLELATALKEEEVYERNQAGDYESAGKKQLLVYGKPDAGLQRYYAADGSFYYHKQVDGQKRLVKDGQLHGVPSVVPPGGTPPAPLPAQDPEGPAQGETPAQKPSGATGQQANVVTHATSINNDTKREIKVAVSEVDGMLQYLDLSKESAENRATVAKAAVESYKRNERFGGYLGSYVNSGDVKALGDRIKKKFADKLQAATSVGGEASALQAMAKGLVDMKADDEMRTLLGAGKDGDRRKLTVARVLVASEALKAGRVDDGVRAASADMLDPQNASQVSQFLGQKASVYRNQAAEGLVKNGGVRELAKLVEADSKRQNKDPKLAGWAVDALKNNSGKIPGKYRGGWLGRVFKTYAEDRAAALSILKAAVVSGDKELREKAIDVGRQLKFEYSEMGVVQGS